MSGKIELGGWDAGIERIRNQVYQGVMITATEVQRVAVIRAPIRKAFQNKHRPTKVDVASFKMKIGRTDQYTGPQLREAAAMLGIGPGDLNISRFKRGSELQVQTGRSGGPNRLSFRGRRERRVISGADGYVVKMPRVTGVGLRQVTPVRMKVGTPAKGQKQKTRIVGFLPNSKRLAKQGVKLTPRARYDIAHKRGVIMGRNGQHQYGGFLRKNIVVDEPKDNGSRIAVSVRSKAPYSRYVEFPTSRTAAQPFLLPALKGARSQLATNIRRGSA